jgi:hypothetical protein
VAFIVLIVWVIAWHRLAIFWLYRILRRSNRYGMSRQNDSPS